MEIEPACFIKVAAMGIVLCVGMFGLIYSIREILVARRKRK